MVPRLLALLAVLAHHSVASEPNAVRAQHSYKRDKITGTVSVDGLLAKRSVDVDLYVYYVPKLYSSNNSCAIEESKIQCGSHECKSADPTYYNVFQLDKEPGVTSTCKKGMILCLPGPLVLSPRQQQELDLNYTKMYNWTKPCTDAGYKRAIRVTATETSWILEAGHQFFDKNVNDPMKPIFLNGTLEFQRSADENFIFNNVFLKKFEGKQQITSPNMMFAHAYERYFMDTGSPCVSKVHGAILPHRIRVIGSPDCHMSATFVSLFLFASVERSIDLAPYSVKMREECDDKKHPIVCRMPLEGRALCNDEPAIEAQILTVDEEATINDTCWTHANPDYTVPVEKNGSFKLVFTTTNEKDCDEPRRVYLSFIYSCNEGSLWAYDVKLPEACRSTPENETLKWCDMGAINLKSLERRVMSDYDERKFALRGRVVCADAAAKGTGLVLTLKRNQMLPHCMISDGVVHPKVNDSVAYFEVVTGAYERKNAENRYAVTFFHQCRSDGLKRFSTVDLPETYQPSVANKTLNWYDMGKIELTKLSSQLITEYKAETEPQGEPEAIAQLLTNS